MKYVWVLLMSFSLNVFAHGDHSTPGAIPPAPHGGILGEAEHQDGEHGHKGHNHKSTEKEESEVFYEAIVKKNLLRVYPLKLETKKGKSFKSMKVTQKNKGVIEILNPRSRKSYNLPIVLKVDHWQINLDKIKGRRFILKIESLYNKDKYKGKIQVERK